jgi:hypothetical protein
MIDRPASTHSGASRRPQAWLGVVVAAVLVVAAACAGNPSDGTGSAPATSTPGTGGYRPPPGANATTTTQPPPVSVAPPTTTAPTTTVPSTPTQPTPDLAGVTLREIDGGADYFGQWSNSFRTDPTFFPIGVWAESFADDQNARNIINNYETMGINFFPEPYGMPNGIANYLVGKGMYTASDSTQAVNAAQKTTDEPDWRGCHPESGNIAAEAPSWVGRCTTIGSTTGAKDSGPISPSFLQAWSDGLRQRDPARPVYGQFTHAEKAGIPGCQEYWNNETVARAYFASADIISFDWYVLTHPWSPDACRYVWYQGDAVANARRLSDYSKPVMPFIETSYIFEDNDYRPTAADVNAEVWNAIIGGARGIQYFNHDFRTGTARVLQDRRFTDITAQVTATNARIRGLAPVLNSPFADGLATVVGGSASVMSKAYDGSYYVFVAPRTTASQSVTLQLAAGAFATATVLDENRTVPVVNGQLVDSFADQNTIHIYKLTPGS